MKVVKYKNGKEGGMAVHFPIGCKNRSGITHHKLADPYLELEDKEAEELVAMDSHNFELADAKEMEAANSEEAKKERPLTKAQEKAAKKAEQKAKEAASKSKKS